MRIVYVTCILLASTVCGIAGDNAGATGGNNSSASHSAKDVSTTVPSTNSTGALPAAVNGPTHVNASNSTNIPANPTSANATGHNATVVPTVPSTDPASAAPPTKPTTVNVTTTIAPSTTTMPTAPPTSEKSTTKSSVTSTASTASTASTGSVTTTGPISTKVAPPSSSPYKERQFDGLSFLGGIILAVCLMAISVFSWKFYRTFNERHYRTL